MSILIKNGRVITGADDTFADVLVEGERISLVGASLDVAVDRVIDATGKYVLPGCIDVHTHLDMPLREIVTCDDFESGQTAAAFGGTTCHIDFATQDRGSTLGEALEAWHAKREGKSIIDNGFHMAVTDLSRPEVIDELAALPEHGVTSYKLYMAYKDLRVSDEIMFRAMRIAAETGALVMVHAENGDVIDVLVKQALAAGHTEPRWHGLTRPPETEGEAVYRAIRLAQLADCPLYVVHVSCREALDPLVAARDNGWRVWGETCPQYLLLDSSYLEREGFEGAEVRVHAARTGPREPGRAVGRVQDRCPLGDLDRPLRVSLGGPEDPWQGRLLEDPERPAGHRDAPRARAHLRRPHRPDHAQPDGRAARNGAGTPRSGSIRGRERSPSAPTQTSSCSTPGRSELCRPRLTTPARTTHLRGSQDHRRSRAVLRRGEVIVEGERLLAAPGSGDFVARARFGRAARAGPVTLQLELIRRRGNPPADLRVALPDAPSCTRPKLFRPVESTRLWRRVPTLEETMMIRKNSRSTGTLVAMLWRRRCSSPPVWVRRAVLRRRSRRPGSMWGRITMVVGRRRTRMHGCTPRRCWEQG